jgi:hypothetical protein
MALNAPAQQRLAGAQTQISFGEACIRKNDED